MSWANPPDKITEARDRLLECQAIQTLFVGLTTPQQQARCHYPYADPVADTMPFIVLMREDEEYARTTVGGTSGRGTIAAVIHLDDSVTTGAAEALVSVASELCSLITDGLYVVAANAERVSEPTPGMQATDDGGQVETGKSYRTVMVSMGWEG